MKQLMQFIGFFAILSVFMVGCDSVVDSDDTDLALTKGQGQGSVTATQSLNTSNVSGNPKVDGWSFQGHSLDAGVFVRGDGDFAFDIYTAAFTLGSGSPLVGDGWEVGDEIVAIGGIIDPDDNNPNLTHSVRIVSKFSAGNDGWSAGGTGSFSSAGGDGALLLATRGPASPWGNTEHLNPFDGYGSSRVATELGPGEIHKIPMLQRVENGSVNTDAGTEAGKFIYLSDGPDFTDTDSGNDAPLLSSWQVFANVTMLGAEHMPVPGEGDRAVQALQRSSGVSTDGLGIIMALAPQNPETREDCMNGGWEDFGFRNQGLCIQFVNTGRDSRTDPGAGDPETRQDCMNGGWQDYGFKNQGQCIQFVNTGRDSR